MFEYFFCETASGGEMQTQQFIPNRYIDIESVMELKRSSHEANRFIKQGVPTRNFGLDSGACSMAADSPKRLYRSKRWRRCHREPRATALVLWRSSYAHRLLKTPGGLVRRKRRTFSPRRAF